MSTSSKKCSPGGTHIMMEFQKYHPLINILIWILGEETRAFLKVKRCCYVPSQQLVCDSLVERKWQSLRPLGGIIETNEGPGFCTRAVPAPGALQGAWRNNLFRRSTGPLHGCTKHLCLNSLAPHLVG